MKLQKKKKKNTYKLISFKVYFKMTINYKEDVMF